MTGARRTALAAVAVLALFQAAPTAAAAGPADQMRCVRNAQGLIELRELLPGGRPVNRELQGSERVRALGQRLHDCGLELRFVYRPVACAARHGRVLELNPYFRERVYVRPSQVVLAYVGVYPFAALPDFRTGTVGDALRDKDVRDGDPQCPGEGRESTGDRIRLDVGVGPVPLAPKACTFARESASCTHVLPATVSCENDGGAMPDGVSQRLALKVVDQIPTAGTLVGLNLMRDGPGRIPALSDFPSFPMERSQVHLLVSCPTQPTPVPELEPTSPTTAQRDPLTGPQPVSQPDPITLLVLGGAAGVAGAVAARAIGRRRKEDPSAVAASQASEPLPPGRVQVRGRPDIP